jgi:hypothetical protein
MVGIRNARRLLALTLIVVGGGLLLLSPSVQAGLISFALGVLLELVGVVMDRRDRP